MRINLHGKSHQLGFLFMQGNLVIFMNQPVNLCFHMVKAFRKQFEIPSVGNRCVGAEIASRYPS